MLDLDRWFANRTVVPDRGKGQGCCDLVWLLVNDMAYGYVGCAGAHARNEPFDRDLAPLDSTPAEADEPVGRLEAPVARIDADPLDTRPHPDPLRLTLLTVRSDDLFRVAGSVQLDPVGAERCAVVTADVELERRVAPFRERAARHRPAADLTDPA
jgi:hypothetical protein